ncbi:MAG TPA: NAD(P)-binding domain-containing protein [Rhodoglobus sp.]|nr:NAD(P)-binding domain-containing protein [Rhodoglobus sp.]
MIEHIAVIGAGRVGTAVARALVAARYEVTLSGSGDPTDLELLSSIVAPGATPRWTRDAVEAADLTIVAVPLHRVATLDSTRFAGKLVVDAMNYWPPVDGELAAFEDAPEGSSAVVREFLPGATVVKTLNHVGYHDLEVDARAAGHPERRGLAVAGDDPNATGAVAGVIERIGYDAVTLPTLAAGAALQPGHPVFGARLTAAEIIRATRTDQSGAAA